MFDGGRGNVWKVESSAPIEAAAEPVPGREWGRLLSRLYSGWSRATENGRCCDLGSVEGDAGSVGWPKTKPLAAAATAVPVPMS